MATSLHAPFDTPVEAVLLPQARLRANRCALTRASLEASGNLPLTFVTTSVDKSKTYTRLEMDDGKIGLYLPGSNLLGQVQMSLLFSNRKGNFQVWEEVRSGGTEMLKESFHVICTTAEKVLFEQS